MVTDPLQGQRQTGAADLLRGLAARGTDASAEASADALSVGTEAQGDSGPSFAMLLAARDEAAAPTQPETDLPADTPAAALDAATERLKALEAGEGGDDTLGAILSDLRTALAQSKGGKPDETEAAARDFFETLAALPPEADPATDADAALAPDASDDDTDPVAAISALISGLIAAPSPVSLAQTILSLTDANAAVMTEAPATTTATAGADRGTQGTVAASGMPGSTATGSTASTAAAATDAVTAAVTDATTPASTVTPAKAATTPVETRVAAAFATTRADAATKTDAPAAATPDATAAPQPVLGAQATVMPPAAPTPSPAASTEPAPQPTRTQQRLAESVAQQIDVVDVADGQTRIELKPHGLGQIEIDVAQASDGTMKVTVRAENPLVLDALRADRQMLGDLMQGRGFSMQGGGPDFEQFGGNRQNRENNGTRASGVKSIAETGDTDPDTAPRMVNSDGMLDLLT